MSGHAAGCLEIDGIYVKVSERLSSLVLLLVRGCSEAEVRSEVDRIKPGQNYQRDDLRELMEALFLRHDLAIDGPALESCGTWRLCSTNRENKWAGMESAIRCRLTIIPERLANSLAQALRFLYTPVGSLTAALLSLLGLLIYLAQFGLHSLLFGVLFRSVHEASALAMLVAIAAIVFAAFFHEVGHCTAVAACGLKVGRIGCGLYWLSPALFSDVSAAWTLTRRQRVTVDSGGIYFQALLCSTYALIATLVSSTDIQVALQVAIVANSVVLISSLNPIMKCDGYWIISDAMGIPNLRRQSEKAIRDVVRTRLGAAKPPTKRSTDNRGFLVCYAIASLLFSSLLLIVFAITIQHNAAEAIYFPRQVWAVLTGNPPVQQQGSAYLHFGFEFVRVLPVFCAPLALLTAVSGLLGFAARSFSKAE
ncbi:MAG: hypothetical protein ACJ746_18170 [Bryobacteraceae bacterium]